MKNRYLDRLVDLHINDIIETNPDLASAHVSLNSSVMGAIAHLSKSKSLRTAAARRAGLAEASKALGCGNRRPLVSRRHAAHARRRAAHRYCVRRAGFAKRISGIADNFRPFTRSLPTPE